MASVDRDPFQHVTLLRNTVVLFNDKQNGRIVILDSVFSIELVLPLWFFLVFTSPSSCNETWSAKVILLLLLKNVIAIQNCMQFSNLCIY